MADEPNTDAGAGGGQEAVRAIAARRTVRQNVFANYVGSGLAALMGIVMSPVYLHLLGREAFGLVALFTTLAAIAAIFEFGISAAVSRQVASVQDGDGPVTRELCSTLELLFAGIGLVLGALLCLGGPFIANAWLNPGELDRETITWSMVWLGLGFALKWNTAFYSAGLNGLERQVELNVVTVLVAVVQYLGVVGILWWWGAGPTVFFAYLAVCGLAQTLVLRRMFWRLMGWGAGLRRWRPAGLGRLRSFAGGVTLISATTIALTQVDKVVLSRLMPLGQFGVYSFASNAAAGTGRIIGPVFNAIYPRMTGLVSSGDRESVMRFYRLCAQMVACLIVPLVVSVAWFAGPLLRVWTRNPDLAQEAEPLLRWFALGHMMSALNHVPYALQLANGWTSLAVWTNVVSLAVLLPCGVLAYYEWGPSGVAAVWFLLNAGYVVCAVPVMHSRLGWEGMADWYRHAVVLPIAISSGMAFLAARLSDGCSDLGRLLAAMAGGIVSVAMIIAVSPAVRAWLAAWWRRAAPGG